MEAEIQLAKDAAPNFVFEHYKDPLRILITRTTDATLNGKRLVDEYLAFMNALINDDSDTFKQHNIDMRTLFINRFKCADTRLEALAELKPEGEAADELKAKKDNLVALIKGALNREILTRADCLINFSSQTLQDAGLILDKDIFDRRLVRLNTSMIYKQNKFNLFREDNVGYAALVNDLIVGSTDHQYDKHNQAPPTSLDRIPSVLQTISSHIGIFHLDPNRVLDILLDFFVRQVLCNHVFWIELFKQSGWMEHISLGGVTSDSSSVMAHLLGFKFDYYQTIQKQNPPKELYHACALLIKGKLIRLHDILPYLYPFDGAMEQKKKSYMESMNKEISTNTGGLLAQFGALGEEGSTQRVKQPKDKEKTKDEQSEEKRANDIVELTRALLAIGDIAHAELLFSKYDKLLDMYPELAHNVYRICDRMLAPLYDSVIPQEIKDKYKLFEQRVQESEIKSALGRTEHKMPELADVLVMDSIRDGAHDIGKRERYVFYCSNWSDDIPKLGNFQDLLHVFLPVMRLAGYKMYLAPNLVAKLLLIVRCLIEREQDFPGCRPYCLAMVREILLPAVSFSQCNPGTMASLWELLEMLTFQERYALYGEWGLDFYKKSIECKLLKARTERAVKSVMQRVSKNDVRQCGRDLGKLANSNPTIVFSVMLDQIQSFDNMAPYMADACRYMGDFTYDVLAYLMTEKWTGFSGAGRMKKSKIKEDGMTSTWLRALSVFSGMLFKKQGLDPTPLLRYMILRLHYDDAVDDLVLFNEFITKICGIEIIGSTMTDDQILSASCSETIKAEAFQPISGDNRKASKRVLTRMKEALQSDGTALDIIVLLHRLREACSAEERIGTAALGSRLDLIHQTINQYVEMLNTLFEPSEYDSLIPDAKALADMYKLPDYLIMQLVRPKTRYALRTYKPDSTETYNADEPHPVFRPLIDQIPAVVSESAILNTITAEFYTLFWQLSLYDIHVPEAHYQAAMKRQTDMIAQCRDNRSSFYLNNRPSMVAKSERQAQACLDSLQEDFPRHKADVEKTMQILRTSQARWFPLNVDRQPLISGIIQHCLLPRSMISEADAVFCFEFVMLIHRLGARNFSSLTLFDKVLSENLPTALLSFTEYETTIHARFLYRTFAKISEWQKDEQLYIKEAHGEGLIGFQKKWNAQTSQDVAKEDLLNFPEFKRVMHKWHLKTSLAIEQALQSGEPHQIRNAFLILKQFIPYFPMIREHGQVLVKTTQELANRERKDHLKVLARSYLGLIEKSKSRWVSKDVFLGLKEAESEKPSSEKASPTSATKPSSASNGEERMPSPDRKRSREDQSSQSTAANEGVSSKRSRYDLEDRPSRDTSKESRRESDRGSVRGSPRELSRSGRESGQRESSTRENSGHSRESSSKDQPPRIRDHAREAIREAARESAYPRDSPRDAIREAGRSSIGGSGGKETSGRELRNSREERRSSRDRRSANIGSNPSSSVAAPGPTNSPAPPPSSSSRKRDRGDEERDRDRTDKRYRDERSSRDERRERDRDRDRERERDRERDRDRDRRRRRRQ